MGRNKVQIPPPSQQVESRITPDKLSFAYALVVTFILPLTAMINGLLGLALALLGIPLWIGRARHHTGALTITLGLVVSLISGWILLDVASGDYSIDSSRATSLSLYVGSGIITLGFLLWSREVLGLPRMAMVYGTGALLNVAWLIDLSSPAWWKSDISWASSLVIMGAAACMKGKLPSVLGLFVIAGISTLTGYRSLAGMCLIAMVLYLYINSDIANRKGNATFKTLALCIVGPLIAIQVFTSLLIGGVLGEAARERTENQVETSGSLIAGGRQEWAASILLFMQRPSGYGPGVIPHVEDVNVGKSGLITLGANPESQYINQYMFGGHFKLHSIVGDFWVNFGLVGLVLSLAIGMMLIVFLIRSIANRRILALSSLLFLWAFWDLMFSPIDSNYHLLIFALAALLPAVESKQPELSLQGTSASDDWRNSGK